MRLRLPKFGRLNRRLDAEHRILAALSDGGWVYGLDLIRRTGLRSDRFYTAVDRLESYGWVIGRWTVEVSDDPTDGVRRRVYRLTEGPT
jgi:DNA-binding PadR family transcriptional regulator